MDKNNLMKAGLIGAAVTAVGFLGSAVSAERKRRKAVKALYNTEMQLGFSKLDNCLKDIEIKSLNKQLQDLKSNCKEKES